MCRGPAASPVHGHLRDPGHVLRERERDLEGDERAPDPGGVVAVDDTDEHAVLAAAADSHDQEDATARFAQFFLATAVPDQGDSKLVPSCRTVAGEFEKLERHRIAGESSNAASGRTTGRGFRLGDGD